MHTLTVYPVGNGDCSQIVLENGKRILADFLHSADSESEDNPKINLKERLAKELEEVGRDYFDVVLFTHSDEDHVKGSSEFFELDHADCYQGDGRIKIETIWVPAAMIVEENLTGCARVLRQECRHRLREGRGIRVFSRPDKLKDWLEGEGLTVEARSEFIVDAGNTISDFTLAEDGVEFFVHSPHARHTDDNQYEMRNEASAILHATFSVSGRETRYLMTGDSTSEVISEIVTKTRSIEGRELRLQWDIFNIPHHCSYKALNENEKGDDKTVPIDEVKWLLEQGNEGAILISSSQPIGSDYNQDLPPHVQAANCYQQYLNENNWRKFYVMMEHRSIETPEPLIIEIDGFGCRPKSVIPAGAGAAITQRKTPKAGAK